MSQKIRTWHELLQSPCRTFLDEFSQGEPHVLIWPDMTNEGLYLGGAIKAAPQSQQGDVQFLSQPATKVEEIRVAVLYGLLDGHNESVVDWEHNTQHRFAGGLGLVDTAYEVIYSLCVPLRSLDKLELVPVF